jgi:hypothetical protein
MPSWSSVSTSSDFARAVGVRPLYFPSAFTFALALEHDFQLELR